MAERSAAARGPARRHAAGGDLAGDASLAVLIAGLLRYTRFGRHSSRSAPTSGRRGCAASPIERTKIAVYALARRSPASPGVLQFSRLSVGDPTVAVGLELDVIAAVIIGGGSLSGGRGTVLGTVLGATIMTVIQIGCSQKGLPPTGSSRSSPAGSSCWPSPWIAGDRAKGHSSP